MRQQGEPSVEEILESIKRVIARDNRETAQVERRHRESAGLGTDTLIATDEDADEDGIFDLGEAVELDEREGREEASPRLTTERTAGAMRESLAALAMLAEPGAQPLGRDIARRAGARHASPDARAMARDPSAGHRRPDGSGGDRPHRRQEGLRVQAHS